MAPNGLASFIPRNSPLGQAGGADMLLRVTGGNYAGAAALAAIARKESEFGRTSGRFVNNPYGWGVHLGPSVNTAPDIETMTRRVWTGLNSNLYKGAGINTVPSILNRYAPPSENNTALYQQQTSSWLRQMGVNPSANIFAPGRQGATPVANTPPAGGRPAGRRAGPAGGAPTGAAGVSPDAAALVLRYAQESEQDVLQGRAPRPIDPILPALAAAVKKSMPVETPAPRGGAPRSGHSAGDGHDHGPNSSVPLSGPVGGFSRGGGPEDHGRRALGNWQSDNAYDIMGRAGQPVYAPIGGQVVKVSGQPGGDPGFAGYGITVRTAQGDLFFKHLGSTPLKVGSRITPGSLVGTLDAKTAGGPHLHLGGTNRRLLDQLYARYVGGR